MADSEELLSEIKKGADLKHSQMADKSAPMIDESVKVQKIDRQSFLNEVRKSRELSHVEQLSDRSSPRIPGDVKIGKSEHPALLEEIRSVNH